MSSVDYLTKLPNRASSNSLSTAPQPAALPKYVFLLSTFTDLNLSTTPGRMTGDMVLQRFAALIGSIVPQDSAMTARLGGQEFVVALLNF